MRGSVPDKDESLTKRHALPRRGERSGHGREDQLDAAVAHAAFRGGVGGERVGLATAVGAEAVVEHLRQRGIALERLSADGRGEADPLTSNATEEGRARNRRVELILSRQP